MSGKMYFGFFRDHLFIGLLLLVTIDSAPADFRGNALLETQQDAQGISIYINGGQWERDVKLERSGIVPLKGTQFTAGIGYDLRPWLTLRLAAGVTDAEMDGFIDADGYSGSWMLGLDARLWSIEFTAPFRVVVNASTTFLQARAGGGTHVEWREGAGALLLRVDWGSLDTVSVASDILMWSLYAGPTFSVLNGQARHGGEREDFTEHRTLGLRGGLEAYLSSELSVRSEASVFESKNHSYDAMWSLAIHRKF